MTDQQDTVLTLSSPEEGIAVLTLNQPDTRNALSSGMLGALLNAVSDISKQDKIKTVILEAKGPAFSVGHDLKEITAHREDKDGGKAFYTQLFAACANVMLGIYQSPKIFIAKVNAPAAAAGCQLAAACDMVFASTEAMFGVTGINSGLFCSTPMVALSRSMGPKKSMELLTTGGLMPADAAAKAGLVNKVVEPKFLDETVMLTAQAIAAKPVAVLALGKQAFYHQLSMPVPQAYEYTTQVIIDNMLREEAKEGIAAFLDKRDPVWN